MKTLRLLLVAGLLLLGSVTTARAQLSLTFTDTLLTGAPGTTLTFAATLLNTGVTELFLNSDNFSLTGAGLTLDDTPFFTNVPSSLASGAFFTGPIFDVVLAPTALPGNYTGTFTVLGGASSTASDTLASENFQVNVVLPQQGIIPEPGVGILLAAGTLSWLGTALRRRR